MKRGLFLILGFFVLFELGIVFAWEPPIGIPRPEFGIEESYRMYDIEANRNPSLLYAMNEEGGFYTHYVDNSVSCIDSGNPYGTAANPRCTIPTIVGASAGADSVSLRMLFIWSLLIIRFLIVSSPPMTIFIAPPGK